jgi:hypothetical protein
MTTYNGYKNYETWNVALWIDNDEHSQGHWASEAADCYRDAEPTSYSTRKEAAASELADRIKADHEEGMPEVQGTYADLLNAALSEVDWHEIASNMIDEVSGEIDDEEKQEEEDQIEEGDITTSDGRTFYQYGEQWLRIDDIDTHVGDAIKAKMKAEGFFPNVWTISDHGNAIPFDLDAE